MKKAMTLTLTGANAAEVAKVLGARLVESGVAVEQVNAATAERVGGVSGAAYLCLLLTRNGVMAINTVDGLVPEGPAQTIAVDANDTPDFAAEKILESLQEDGVLGASDSDYSEEEEEEIKRRLADLGYIE